MMLSRLHGLAIVFENNICQGLPGGCSDAAHHERLRFHDNMRGGLYECFVADALHKSGHVMRFYRNESSKREVDFLVQREGRVVPVEVKSGRSAANSLRVLMKGSPEIDLAYKVAHANVGVGEDGVITIPHYMAMFI